MSLPRPGHDYCPSCYGGPGGFYEECRCNKMCRECGGMTNHTTRQHRDMEAEQMKCHECGVNDKMDDDPDTRVCRACYEESIEWRYIDAHDHLAKDEGGSN